MAEIYRRAGEGHRSGKFPLDSYLSGLRSEKKPHDPRFVAQQRTFTLGDHLIKHMQDVPVLILTCVEGRSKTIWSGRTSFSLRINLPRNLVVDAGFSRPRDRLRNDDSTHRAFRARHGQSLAPRGHYSGGTVGSGLLYWLRLQTSKACTCG